MKSESIDGNSNIRFFIPNSQFPFSQGRMFFPHPASLFFGKKGAAEIPPNLRLSEIRIERIVPDQSDELVTFVASVVPEHPADGVLPSRAVSRPNRSFPF